MIQKSRGEVDLSQLEALASNPAALEELLLADPASVLNALRVDRSQALTAAEMRTLLSQELSWAREALPKRVRLPDFSEVEQAVPGRMTDEEFANVLAGGTRKRRP